MAATLLSGCTIGNTEFVLDKNDVGRNDVFSINGEECTKDVTLCFAYVFPFSMSAACAQEPWAPLSLLAAQISA